MSTLKTNKVQSATTSDLTLDTGSTTKRIVIPTTTGDDVDLNALSGRLVIGNTTGNHLAIDENEIEAKSNPTTATTLFLQRDGGKIAACTAAGVMGIGTDDPKLPLDIFEMGGLICGYTAVDSGGANEAYYTITTSYEVPNNSWRIRFIAPKSGKVEIQFLGKLVCTSTGPGNIDVFLGLSTGGNGAYSVFATRYEKKVAEPDQDDNVMVAHSWYLDSLSAGATYDLYVGTKVSGGTTTRWYYGGTNADQSPPIIIRAVTLPNTIPTTGS